MIPSEEKKEAEAKEEKAGAKKEAGAAIGAGEKADETGGGPPKAGKGDAVEEEADGTGGTGGGPPKAGTKVPPSFPDTLLHTEVYEPETSWLCCTRYKDKSKFMTILQNLPLSPVQKQIIEIRYLHILRNLQQRTRNHAIVFYLGHFIITVGSLFVPALLSIQNSDQTYALTGSSFNVHVYWAAFALSLLVTIWNGILTLFKIDKKYYFLNTILERLRSEGWQYVSLTGRYSGHLIGKRKPTHENQFVYFTHYIEKIKMKQIEEEYYKTDEKSQAPSHGTTASSTASTASTASSTTGNSTVDWYAPSLDKPLPFMVQQMVPEPVRSAMDSLSMPSLPAVYDVYPPYYSAGTYSTSSASSYAPRSVSSSASSYTPRSVSAPYAARTASAYPSTYAVSAPASASYGVPTSYLPYRSSVSSVTPVRAQTVEPISENPVSSVPSSTASSKVTTPVFSAVPAPTTPPPTSVLPSAAPDPFSLPNTSPAVSPSLPSSSLSVPTLISSPSLRALHAAALARPVLPGHPAPVSLSSRIHASRSVPSSTE